MFDKFATVATPTPVPTPNDPIWDQVWQAARSSVQSRPNVLVGLIVVLAVLALAGAGWVLTRSRR
jgi:hypothetical protein